MTDQVEQKAETKAAQEPAEKKSKMVKVRVIVDHEDYKINDVVKLDADAAQEAVAGGWADAEASAVAYAEKLAKADADAE